jgi:hypothetical protein
MFAVLARARRTRSIAYIFLKFDSAFPSTLYVLPVFGRLEMRLYNAVPVYSPSVSSSLFITRRAFVAPELLIRASAEASCWILTSTSCETNLSMWDSAIGIHKGKGVTHHVDLDQHESLGFRPSALEASLAADAAPVSVASGEGRFAGRLAVIGATLVRAMAAPARACTRVLTVARLFHGGYS